MSDLPLALDRREAVDYLRREFGIRISASTLNSWASRRPDRAPRHSVIAGYALYRVQDLDAWARQQLGIGEGA